ncbi:acetate--CoA ligase family protein [Haladaptatus pallidirubidus]|uniref:acetate--CoA ligase (ADP-forming) n=1 Tax=Haladaptatus pallidirubidus TaxID=1008152 RepID=A0AAV3UNY3_9EURY|nr:acetate--CoA ligase family protein [Haladaptatus pallidirubidus]
MSDPIATARADGRTILTEAESKSLLANADVMTPAFRIAEDAEAAVESAEAIGYPVVVKVSAPSIVHKSEWADSVGVALGLETGDAVHEAAQTILDAATAAEIEANVLVEAAHDTDSSTEVIVGALRDPSFGPVVLVGLGGVFTEVFADTSHRLAPIDRAEARSAIEELQAIRILDGYRGRPPADVSALADVIKRVGDLVVDYKAIAEVDVNPVLATDTGAVALDAAVVLQEE